jgi:hypothetical protein
MPEVVARHGARPTRRARGAQIHLSPPGEPGKWGRNSLTGIDGSSRRTIYVKHTLGARSCQHKAAGGIVGRPG